ncbi:hypothetical protein [Actinopolymorpha singaporensis]|uniref:Uncharacterized protein n=1 Tax=Actinopolymorpha singaporensis TaxID=117157 RepID=A0A1H1LH62_9ACTN|nr:hypothetical protein [Actinopolymorpha singaporensis]SDR73365.1 hypothetical protein SAMN04489717_0313 [Actinopolymorpha singaporensis]
MRAHPALDGHRSGRLRRAAPRPTHRRLAAAVAALVLGAVVVASYATSSYAAPADPAKERKVFSIGDARITESSGLAASAVHRGYFYTHNDSGDEPRVFLVDPRGRVAGTISLRTAENVDWEAIAPGPERRIWVGDIGDNTRVRDRITIYRFREPESPIDQPVEWSRFRFRYPDGAHDAEALLVDPRTARVYVVTKDPGGGAIYAAPANLVAGTTAPLTKVADAPAMVTDGAFLPDGSAIVLRTYADVRVLRWPGGKPERTIPLSQPQRQGESLAVGADGKRLFLGSEGANSAVYELPFTAAASAPSRRAPNATPSPSPSPTAQAPTSAGSDGSLMSGLPRWILLLVIAAALLAGLAAYPASRRRPRPGPGRAQGSRRPPVPSSLPSADPGEERWTQAYARPPGSVQAAGYGDVGRGPSWPADPSEPSEGRRGRRRTDSPARESARESAQEPAQQAWQDDTPLPWEDEDWRRERGNDVPPPRPAGRPRSSGSARSSGSSGTSRSGSAGSPGRRARPPAARPPAETDWPEEPTDSSRRRGEEHGQGRRRRPLYRDTDRDPEGP